MNSRIQRLAVITIALLVATSQPVSATTPTSDLKASARDGQVFLTWKEADTPAGTTFNAYVSDSPIADVAKARRVAHHIEPHSARDWWEDPASFKKDAPAGAPVGFRIENGGPRLDPQDGLFVYTVPADAKGQFFFAITSSDPSGAEDTAISTGANSLAEGVVPAPGAIRPIWQRDGQPPAPGVGKDKPLWLILHAKGGVVANMEYLIFGDDSMGWRPGLSFKFSVRIEKDGVVVRPTDRVWINRPHDEAADGGTPAIWTFWYGYNSHIYDRKLMATGVPTNYTERRNLWILNWVREQYQPDSNRWYCSGSSMGGCGTISFGLRHPELFAACHAHVPIVNYTYVGETGRRMGPTSASRLEPCCWTGPIPPDLKTNEGVSLLDRMNGAKFVSETAEPLGGGAGGERWKGARMTDLPYLFLENGRQDGSIPWRNNPPFYRALTQARQGFAAYWDNGTHPTSGKDAPDDIKAWAQRFLRFRLDESYPAFANASSDRNPGNGAPDDGDIIGWMNRGMDWKDIEDAPDHYSIVLLADFPDIQYPVRADITLRRVQKFKTAPGEKLSVQIGDDAPISLTTGPDGKITVPQVPIPSKSGVRITIHRS